MVYENVLIWIDDILFFGTTVGGLLMGPWKIFRKTSQSKCYSEYRYLSMWNYLFHDKETDPMMMVSLPNETQLHQGSLSWIRNTLPQYASESASLQHLLRESMVQVGSMKSSKSKSVNFLKDGRINIISVSKCQSSNCCHSGACLSERRSLDLIVHTCFRYSLALVVTQIPPEDVAESAKTRVIKHWHLWLGLLLDLLPLESDWEKSVSNGSFVGQAETSCIWQAVTIYSDHKNLVQMFKLSEKKDVKKRTVDKLKRWAARLFNSSKWTKVFLQI